MKLAGSERIYVTYVSANRRLHLRLSEDQDQVDISYSSPMD